MEGELWKWTNYWNGWQSRWFILENGVLSYYKSFEEVEQGCKGSIKVSACEISLHPRDSSRLDLSIPGQQHMYVKARSDRERQQWLIALGSAKAGIDMTTGNSPPPSNGSQHHHHQNRRSSDASLTGAAAGSGLEPGTSTVSSPVAAKRTELRVYCDALMQQVHDVKKSVQEGEVGGGGRGAKVNVELLNEGSYLLSETCDAFISTLDDLMAMMMAVEESAEVASSPGNDVGNGHHSNGIGGGGDGAKKPSIHVSKMSGSMDRVIAPTSSSHHALQQQQQQHLKQRQQQQQHLKQRQQQQQHRRRRSSEQQLLRHNNNNNNNNNRLRKGSAPPDSFSVQEENETEAEGGFKSVFGGADLPSPSRQTQTAVAAPSAVTAPSAVAAPSAVTAPSVVTAVSPPAFLQKRFPAPPVETRPFLEAAAAALEVYDLLRPSQPSSYLSASKSSSASRLRRLRSSFSSDPPGFFLLEAMAEADERREDVALVGRELKFIMSFLRQLTSSEKETSVETCLLRAYDDSLAPSSTDAGERDALVSSAASSAFGSSEEFLRTLGSPQQLEGYLRSMRECLQELDRILTTKSRG